MENNSNNQEFVFTNEEPELMEVCSDCGKILPISELTRVFGGQYVCNECRTSDRYTICEECGNIVPAYFIQDFEDDLGNHHHICSTCKRIGYRKCEICGKWVSVDKTRQLSEGGYICDNCFADPDEDWVECEDCSRVMHERDAHTALTFQSGEGIEMSICDRCFRQDYRTCSNCGEIVRYEDLRDSTDGYICPNCFDEYVTCNNCGIYVREDEADWDEDDEAYYCRECAGSTSLIRGYHQGPGRRFFGEMPFGKQGHFGYELEIDREDCDRSDERALTRELVNIAGDRLYFEHDGSLNYGFEIISQPHTYEAMMNDMPIEDILEACRRFGYTSHSAGTCGLHFHISRQFFGTIRYRDTAIEKMMYFYDTYYEDVKRFARRTDEQLHWCGKNSYDDNKRLHIKDKHKKYDDILKDYKDHDDRYRIVNTTNRDTVEIRVMRGTLKYSTFMASFDFIYNIAKNSKNITWNQIDDLTLWFKGMKAETFDYMQSKNAFTQFTDNQ